MDTKTATFTTLNEMLNSCAFQSFESDRLGNDLFINDPDRAERCYDAAEQGCDGSTHAEHIQDWRDFLDTLDIIDPEWPDEGGDITQAHYDSIMAEIDECEEWHANNGSLEQ